VDGRFEALSLVVAILLLARQHLGFLSVVILISDPSTSWFMFVAIVVLLSRHFDF